MNQPHRFSGRTAIVTGAASGIGRVTTLRLAGGPESSPPTSPLNGSKPCSPRTRT